MSGSTLTGGGLIAIGIVLAVSLGRRGRAPKMVALVVLAVSASISGGTLAVLSGTVAKHAEDWSDAATKWATGTAFSGAIALWCWAELLQDLWPKKGGAGRLTYVYAALAPMLTATLGAGVLYTVANGVENVVSEIVQALLGAANGGGKP